MDDPEGLVNSSLQILAQPISFLSSSEVTDAVLRYESAIVDGSTPGKHLRHVHDHFRILVEALEHHLSSPSPSASPTSSSSHPRPVPIPLDYDLRSSTRLPALETSLATCLAEFRTLHARLAALFHARPTLLLQPVRLCATTPAVVETDSTVGREVWFCALHAIHHYALARVILQKECGCTLEPQFGVAPSTLVHREWKRAEEGEGRDQRVRQQHQRQQQQQHRARL